MKSTILKCEPVTIIILLVLFIGSNTGMYFIARNKTTTLNQYQYITQENHQNQNVNTISVSGVIDITTRDSHGTINLEIDNITNIRFSTTSNSITNEIENKIIIK